MKNLMFLSVLLAVSTFSAGAGILNQNKNKPLPAWAYDAGPSAEGCADGKKTMGCELIDLNSRIPNFPEISKTLLGAQKYRPVFGPMPWRMQQKPNSVKILFIGQDGTHIAEAAGRPATAGFGGRAQDLAKYFGVSDSAAFINTYAFTIKGQYGSFNTPMVRNRDSGTPTLFYSSFVDNQLWSMTQDLGSPIVQWRNELIDWIIRNNRESLKMIVLFGGAARDAAASYVISKGGEVGTRFSEKDLANISVPEISLEPAGGNNEVPVPLTTTGSDLYSEVLGRKASFMTTPDGKESKDIAEAKKILEKDIAQWANQLVFSNGGLQKSGILNPAQLGGYDLDGKMTVNGVKTISLKGLKISDDLTVDHDILLAQLPHPTYLSGLKTKKEAADAVKKSLKSFQPYVEAGWSIPADPTESGSFFSGQDYEYARADIGASYYNFGAPATRMVSKSDASRSGSNVIILGTRDKARFDTALIAEMTNAKPAKYPAKGEMWTARPRLKSTRYIFDPGPGEKFARIMKENVPAELIKKYGVNRDFAHYRGSFKNPSVLVLADPHGYDDIITARALTGARGQYIQGLMNDFAVKDQYLVIKTAPFSNDDDQDFANIVEATKVYRETVIRAVLAEGKTKLILTDGPFAKAEMARILGADVSVPVVNMDRGAEKNSGIIAAGNAISMLAIPGLATKEATGAIADIPRSHLSYYARLWEGTSGDRVITSLDPKYKGKAFAEVAPKWAYTQRTTIAENDQALVDALIARIENNGLRLGSEAIPSFLERTGSADEEDGE